MNWGPDVSLVALSQDEKSDQKGNFLKKWLSMKPNQTNPSSKTVMIYSIGKRHAYRGGKWRRILPKFSGQHISHPFFIIIILFFIFHFKISLPLVVSIQPKDVMTIVRGN